MKCVCYSAVWDDVDDDLVSRFTSVSMANRRRGKNRLPAKCCLDGKLQEVKNL